MPDIVPDRPVEALQFIQCNAIPCRVSCESAQEGQKVIFSEDPFI